MASDAEQGFLPYRVMRTLLRAAVTIFFRRMEVVGLENVPHEGPTLFCANHSNSMLDPVMITVFSGRIVHFAAADILFRNPVLRVCLRLLGAVPIRRRQDHGGSAQDNKGAFDAVYDVLAQGRSMGIFPEGMSHDEPHLVTLRTGPARLALGAAQAHGDARVRIVPCGFYYTNRRRFRASVLLQFGEPLEMDAERLAAYETSPRETVRAVTDDLEEAIRSLTVNAEDWDTARILDGVRRMYQPERIQLKDRVELARRFNLTYPEVRDDPAVVEIAQRTRAYLDSLHILGLRDRDVQREFSTRELAWRTAGYGLLILVYLPLAIVGAPLHGPLGLLLKLGGTRFSPRKDTIAATKLMGGFFLVLMIYGALVASTFWLYSGAAAGGLALFLPLSGWSFIHVVARGQALTRLYATTAEMLLLRRQIGRLRAERLGLQTAIHEAVDRLVPEEMERLFPSRTHELKDGADPAQGSE
jgi:glycerol-3-phosphate O-acyltransferase/dihydroxyacetone phosphate acyltransferase